MSNQIGLGWWLDQRRADLGMKWDDLAEHAGVSVQTLYRAANKSGRSMRTPTKRQIEQALRWERGSIDAIIGGGEPTPLPEPEQPRSERPLSEILEEFDSWIAEGQKLREEIAAARGETERRRTG